MNPSKSIKTDINIVKIVFVSEFIFYIYHALYLPRVVSTRNNGVVLTRSKNNTISESLILSSKLVNLSLSLFNQE